MFEGLFFLPSESNPRVNNNNNPNQSPTLFKLYAMSIYRLKFRITRPRNFANEDLNLLFSMFR